MTIDGQRKLPHRGCNTNTHFAPTANLQLASYARWMGRTGYSQPRAAALLQIYPTEYSHLVLKKLWADGIQDQGHVFMMWGMDGEPSTCQKFSTGRVSGAQIMQAGGHLRGIQKRSQWDDMKIMATLQLCQTRMLVAIRHPLRSPFEYPMSQILQNSVANLEVFLTVPLFCQPEGTQPCIVTEVHTILGDMPSLAPTTAAPTIVLAFHLFAYARPHLDSLLQTSGSKPTPLAGLCIQHSRISLRIPGD
ncbi:hypothetical protein FA13DRAFT_1707921 [Coprinellus micaceus]|uniref:Uncharacterized protein n=1 Tax=Coprinellus micaceus TaxID=71717 RepID=A0A4Y7TI38_COPMI|nr:hypothetical protein FA13DRAFT_1707921 [Coprinellus micaceus]